MMSDTDMEFQITPLGDALGAAITGIDLSWDLGPDTVAGLRRAWNDHVILVFPGQKLSEADQERFCRHFGELEKVRSTSLDENHPHTLLITNVRDTGMRTALEDGDMQFHYDQCYYEQPCDGSTLYALEVTSTGGNTLFANCRRAYDNLPDDLKRRIAGARALNYYDYGAHPTFRPDSINPDAPQWVHPVVRTHNETGRKAIYVNRLMTIRIEGMDRRESDDLLGRLFDAIEAPENIYEHRWKIGDLMLWDNRCSVHARTYFEPDDRRMMRRVTIRGAAPVV